MPRRSCHAFAVAMRDDMMLIIRFSRRRRADADAAFSP